MGRLDAIERPGVRWEVSDIAVTRLKRFGGQPVRVRYLL
jgi:hypothetical protein